jgi:RNA polymerase sigma-70 factor, ECF subfamily
VEVLLPRLADRPAPSPSEGVEPIVVRARAGDVAAATELVRRLGPRAERFCRHLGAPPGAEDDVVQEALVALLRSLPRFAGRSSIETWLYAVCVRVVRQHRRAHLRLLHAVRSFAAEARATQPPAAPPDRDERREAAVLRVLARLPRRRREVLVLYEMEERSAPEIAVILGIPEATVYTRLFHARRAFRRLAERAPELSEEVP